MKTTLALLAILSSLTSFQVQAAYDPKAVTRLVSETIDLSELDTMLSDLPSDLNQLQNVLTKNALLNSEVLRELASIRRAVADAMTRADDGLRSHQLEIAKFRLLLLAGELGYIPQGR